MESAKCRPCVLTCLVSSRPLRVRVLYVFACLACLCAWRATKSWCVWCTPKNGGLGVLQKNGMLGVFHKMACLKLLIYFLVVFDHGALVNCRL